MTRMARARAGIAAGVLTLACAPAQAGPTEVYRAVRAAAPDGRTIAVEDFRLQRDVFEFTFSGGVFHLVEPVDDRTYAAVYLGPGRVRVDPIDARERHHLSVYAKATSGGIYEDRFDAALLFFTDDTWERLQVAGPVAPGGSGSDAARGVLERQLQRQREQYRTNLRLRVARALLHRGQPDGRLFLAFFDGADTWPVVMIHDPFGARSVRISNALGGEENAIYAAGELTRGFVYSGHTEKQLADGGWRRCRLKRLVDVTHYEIDTTFPGGREIRGTTTLTLRPEQRLQVLPIDLMGHLRIESAARLGETDGAEQALDWVQEKKYEDFDAAVLLPTPLEPGVEARLRIRYAGKEVLEDAGDGNYYVQARSRWYAGVDPLYDEATFDLTFRHDPENQVISVGEPAGVTRSGEQAISRWQSEVPIKVAGFNYGTFERLESVDEVSKTTIEVYTNPGTPDIVKEIQAYFGRGTAARDSTGQLAAAGALSAGTSWTPGQTVIRQSFNVDPASLAQAALADGTNAAKLFHTIYGPLSVRRIAITQQSQWAFGQAWPSLIYLPYLAFLSSTERVKIGYEGISRFIDEVGLHEMAHQWWGHEVGWDSYRDQWLSEGFASFSTGYALERIEGRARANVFWRDQRKRVLAGDHYREGSVTQGWRLANPRNDYAYGPIVYSKGAFVLHMLRMMMRETGAPDPDARFFAMLRDFFESARGRSASTEEFQDAIERHMIPALDAERNGKVDWFFRQWVYGTEIPRYESDFKIEKAGRGKYRIHGSISQRGVSDGFLAIVPIYLDFGKDRLALLGRAPFRGNMSQSIDRTMELPSRPKKVVANANFEVLSLR